MNILGRNIGLDQSVTLEMDIAKLHTRTRIVVPIIVERGKTEGPCLLITGGIHGDEVNGIEIVRQIITKKINKPDCGTIICIPVLNVFGFINQSRELPDGRDLNRVFPGSKGGSLASRFAFFLMDEIAPYVDYAIDYHTGGALRFNHSQLRIDGDDDETVRLAKAFGTKFIVFSKNRERSYRETMIKMGKKVLLFEGGKSHFLAREITRSGVAGAENVIKALGMIDQSSERIADYPRETEQHIIVRTKWIRAKYSGMFRSYVKIGQRVEKNVILGSISDPFGDFEKPFTNPEGGYILNSNHSPVVNQGDALFHIGYEN